MATTRGDLKQALFHRPDETVAETAPTATDTLFLYDDNGSLKNCTVANLFSNPDTALTIGVDDTGYNVTFFGDTTGKSFQWVTASDQMYLKGQAKHHDHLSTGDYAYQLRTEHNAATGTFYGFDCEVHQAISKTANSLIGFGMTARLVATKTMSGAGGMYAIWGQLDIDGTLNSGGIHAAGYLNVDAGGTFTAVSHLASLWLNSAQEGTVNGEHELLYMTNNGASTMDQAIFLYPGNKITHLITIDPTDTGLVGDATGETLTPVKKINVKIDGTTYVIHAGTSA